MAALACVVACCLVAPLHFFETFPNGWDQTEFVWCVQAGFLPHSPYVAFVFAGRVLALFVSPAVALSSLSLLSGVCSLVLFHYTLRRLGRRERKPGAGVEALSATFLLGISTVFVRHSATQEVYSFQLCLLLASAALLVSSARHRVLLGGLVYGCAIAAHNASVFVLPALLLLLISTAGDRGKASSVLAWVGAASAALGTFYGLTAILLPAAPGERLAELLVYLRGMPPGVQPDALADVSFLARSVQGFVHRLTSGEIEVTRGPLATGPVGLGALHFAAALAGLVLLVWRSRAPVAAGFLLWSLPFVLYELALGWNLDYGTYVVYVVPPLCALSGVAIGWLAGLSRRSRALHRVLAVALVFALALPAFTQLAAHWGDIARDRSRHDSPTTLAAVFAARALPQDAVVVQATTEWNANLLPFHAQRRHVARLGARLMLLRSREPFTPMKPEAYDLLTTDRLAGLLREGIPVIAFEEDPLRGANRGALDASRFVWRSAGHADLGVAAKELGLSDERRAHLEGRSVPLYRAELTSSR